MNKYSLVAISMILIMGLCLSFTCNEINSDDYDYSGLVTDIEKSSKGYTFNIVDGNQSIKCYYSEKPNETYYNINGEFSEDGKIFFVSSMNMIG